MQQAALAAANAALATALGERDALAARLSSVDAMSATTAQRVRELTLAAAERDALVLSLEGELERRAATLDAMSAAADEATLAAQQATSRLLELERSGGAPSQEAALKRDVERVRQ